MMMIIATDHLIMTCTRTEQTTKAYIYMKMGGGEKHTNQIGKYT